MVGGKAERPVQPCRERFGKQKLVLGKLFCYSAQQLRNERGTMPITLRQLADRIHVAPSTISRALSGDAGVSEERARTIRRLAEELGYRPKPLRRKVNNTIGLIVSSSLRNEPDDAYQGTLVGTAMMQVGNAGWHLHSEVVERGLEFPKLVEENRVDGVLLCGHPSPELCARLRDLRFPAVALDDLYERTGLPSVIPDVGVATAEVVARLRAMGHGGVALVATTDRYPSMASRIEGYREALGFVGDCGGLLLLAGQSSLQQGQVATRQLMQLPQPPTAVVYATDLLAVGGMIELGRLGLRVPQDASIAGHDNTPFARDADPSMTSVDLNQAAMIAMAFDLLRGMIESGPQAIGEDERQRRVASRVVWRGSCGPAMGMDLRTNAGQ
jgi:LacI family transcriptional regulator